MTINFRSATFEDSELIGTLVVALTTEICQLTNNSHFDIDLNDTVKRCKTLFKEGHYSAIIANNGEMDIGIVTMTETYALYAGGKIGLLQEFYILPECRAGGIGSMLFEQVKQHANTQQWACIELCTPPLPEFERTLNFYLHNGLMAVGGRKMRLALA